MGSGRLHHWEMVLVLIIKEILLLQVVAVDSGWVDEGSKTAPMVLIFQVKLEYL